MQAALRSVLHWLFDPSDGKVPWQRVLAVVVLGLFSLIFAIAWDQRVIFVTTWATHEMSSDYRIDEDRAPRVLAALMRSTGALAAASWEYDLPQNTRRLIFAASAEGKRLIENLDTLPILRSGSPVSAQVLAAVWSGAAPCLPISDDTSPDVRIIRQETGVTAFCITGIRTPFGQLRGSVLVFLRETPRDPDLVAAALRTAAAALLQAR